ncbi:unnamed protein product [Lathyrus sativus]|nr:unnamed protein product [Lathyrus sativus]
MLPPLYKKGLGRPKKLRFIEHDETGSRMRWLGVAYRCTKCDKFVHDSRKFQSTEQDPNALKRKRKTPRTNASSIVREGVSSTFGEGVSSIVNDDLDFNVIIEEMMAEFEHQPFQYPQSKACNTTNFAKKIILNLSTPSKVKNKLREKKKHAHKKKDHE